MHSGTCFEAAEDELVGMNKDGGGSPHPQSSVEKTFLVH